MKILKKTVAIIVILSSACAVTYAQSNVPSDLAPILRKGNKKFYKEQYYEAIPFYKKLLDKDSSVAEGWYRLGISYLNTESYQKGLAYIRKYRGMVPNDRDRYFKFWLARGLHLNYRFDSAITYYKKYRESFGENNTEYEKINRRITECKNGKKLCKNPVNYYIKNAGKAINSKYPEHSPVLHSRDSTLLFTSRKKTEDNDDLAPDGMPLERVYKSTLDASGEWKAPVLADKRLNSKAHNSVIQSYENDKTLLIYFPEKSGDIYYSEKQNGRWSKPDRFPGINSPAKESDAYITPDGKTIYFSTDFYSTDGDLGIFVSRKRDGKWQEPENIGFTINTPYHDLPHYFDQDKKVLYFSSQGHNSMGGFDLFKSRFNPEASSWSEPENLGHPVNTPGDDLHFQPYYNRRGGLITSFRKHSVGEKDIYSIVPVPMVQVSGRVRDSLGRYMNNISVSFISCNREPRYSGVSKVKDGSYQDSLSAYRKYNVYFIEKGDTLHQDSVEIPMKFSSGAVTFDFRLPVGEKQEELPEPEEVFSVKVYFDFKKEALNKRARKQLNRLYRSYKETPDFPHTIVIEGHTDDVGSKEENMKLSRARAERVYNYLVKRGIPKEKMVIKGLGESAPVVPNTSEANRAKNRRVEFKLKK